MSDNKNNKISENILSKPTLTNSNGSTLEDSKQNTKSKNAVQITDQKGIAHEICKDELSRLLIMRPEQLNNKQKIINIALVKPELNNISENISLKENTGAKIEESASKAIFKKNNVKQEKSRTR